MFDSKQDKSLTTAEYDVESNAVVIEERKGFKKKLSVRQK